MSAEELFNELGYELYEEHDLATTYWTKNDKCKSFISFINATKCVGVWEEDENGKRNYDIMPCEVIHAITQYMIDEGWID